MSPLNLIIKKRDGRELMPDEIERIVSGFNRGLIPDYQMTAFLMAVYYRGLTPGELTAYTKALVASGRTLNWNYLSGMVADKHSSGGVGDKTTLVVAPLMAASGIYMPKMSGRGLGFTGGTIDKLESIPGFNTELSLSKMQSQVERIGLAVVSQTAELTPADGRIYALRDVTATVDSIPLIAGSIMSKKIAGGASCIVLDVKVGSGAFMRSLTDAAALAETMVSLGQAFGRRVKALITDMDQPLGRAIGNSLEIEEAVSTLQGEGPDDLKELALSLGTHLLCDAVNNDDAEAARSRLRHLLDSGDAYEKFLQMVEAQGGDPRSLEKGLEPARFQREIRAGQMGYLQKFDALHIGRAAALLGSGRQRKGDTPDRSAGIYLHAQSGDKVEEGMPLMTLYTDREERIAAALEEVHRAVRIATDPVPPRPLIHDTVS
ncbi:MAG: thymidine phosphorylase [Dethiobacteria bacterium]